MCVAIGRRGYYTLASPQAGHDKHRFDAIAPSVGCHRAQASPGRFRAAVLGPSYRPDFACETDLSPGCHPPEWPIHQRGNERKRQRQISGRFAQPQTSGDVDVHIQTPKAIPGMTI